MAERVKLATPEEVADWLQITPNALAKLRQRGNGPKAIKITDTRLIRYAWSDVHAWCAANRGTPAPPVVESPSGK